MEGVRRIARIVGEEVYAPAEALYDEAEGLSDAFGNYGHLAPYIGVDPKKMNRNKKFKTLGQGAWRHAQQNIQAQILHDEKADLPRKKSMAKGRATVKRAQKKLVQRSSMVVSGQLKVKHKKNVQVSKQLREKVKKVMEGVQAQGSYKTITCGYVGTLVNATTGNASPNSAIQGNLTATFTGPLGLNEAVVLFGGIARPPSRTIWNNLGEFSSSATTLSQLQDNFVAGGELNFFTIGKILDAAAVLFNEKAPTAAPYNSTGNLSTTWTSTGANPVEPGNLKINVLNSYASFTMKNVSNRVVTVEIWECVPTLKFIDSGPLVGLVNAETRLLDATTTTREVQYGIASATAGVFTEQSGIYLEPNFEFASLFAKYGFKWSFRKRKMVMAPQETCVHTIKGPSGVLNTANLYDEEVFKIGALKGWTVSCLISVVGDQVIVPGADGNGSIGGLLHDSRGVTAVNPYTMGAPIAVQVEEFYSIAVPEIAGFLSNPTSSLQMLNQRRSKKVVWNRQGLNGAQAFSVSNEVTPMVPVTTLI